MREYRQLTDEDRIEIYAERKGMQIKNPEHRLGGDYYVEIAEGDAKSGEASYWVNQGRKKTKVVVYRNGEK